MVLIVTGIVFALVGYGNIVVSGLHADRPNARLTRRLGYVGIGCGVLTLIGGIAQLAGFGPPPLPPAQ